MNLKNKKIGIWGFGVVGQSVFNYVKRFTNYVHILDQKPHQGVSIIMQTPETIKNFLEENDYIIPSPGIILNGYESYRHKFICELDLFTSEFKGTVIAITGTAGKTTVTDFIAQSIPRSVAAGNIGLAMLDVLKLDHQPTTTVLELSSYQLQYATNFAPDIAIWTNFFPNHLDHHKDIDEYFISKCNILKNQIKNQKAIIPFELTDQILKTINYQAELFTYSIHKPNISDTLDSKIRGYFYLENNNLMLCKHKEIKTIFPNFNTLPKTTFQENWITIIAALYLANQDISSFKYIQHKPQPHRVEYIGTYKNVLAYNDSKSTIQESTKQALSLFTDKKVALILGGMSKGTNRKPLIAHIAQQKNITPFIFGKEKEILTAFCDKHQLKYFATETLEELLNNFTENHTNFDVLLFSPAGSSFDQFKNYQDRGEVFKKSLHALIIKN